MNDLTVGVRDLKSRLSQYLRLVKSGKTLVITEHGKPVGRILPIEDSLEHRLLVLKQAGLVSWNGQKLSSTQPGVINRSAQLVSDILVEMRE